MNKPTFLVKTVTLRRGRGFQLNVKMTLSVQQSVWRCPLNTKPMLIRSMLTAGIVQDKVAGEAWDSEGGEEETTWRLLLLLLLLVLLPLRLESLPFLRS